MKNDKREVHILTSLQETRFIDLLKLYTTIQKKAYTILSSDKEGIEVEDMVRQYIEIGNLIDTEITKKIIRIQRSKMYEYTSKTKGYS